MGRISKVSTTAKTKWVALAATLVVATAEALAQEKQSARVGWGQEASRTAEAGRIVVSIPDRKLALVEGGRVVKSYDVAVGADESPSPSGEFKITHRIPHPTFYAPGVIIPPGKENPLGTRWLGLNQATASTAPTSRARSGIAPRTAAFACATATLRSCSSWCARVMWLSCTPSAPQSLLQSLARRGRLRSLPGRFQAACLCLSRQRTQPWERRNRTSCPKGETHMESEMELVGLAAATLLTLPVALGTVWLCLVGVFRLMPKAAQRVPVSTRAARPVARPAALQWAALHSKGLPRAVNKGL